MEYIAWLNFIYWSLITSIQTYIPGFIPLFYFLSLFVLFHSYLLFIHFHFTIIWFIMFHSASFCLHFASFRLHFASFRLHFASFRLHFASFRLHFVFISLHFAPFRILVGPLLTTLFLTFLFLYTRWSSMCVEICVKISDKSDKNEVIAYSYKLSS